MATWFETLFGGLAHGENWQTSQAIPLNPTQAGSLSNFGAPIPGPYQNPFAGPGPSALAALQNAQQNAFFQAALGSIQNVTGIATLAAPTAKTEPIEDAGIRPGEVAAFRCWRFDSGLLRSAFTDTIWAPGETMTGSTKAHGVHAWKTLSKTLEYGLGKRPVVIGQVDLWGEIVEHEHGYRAEFAAITALDGIIGADQATLSRLRTLYKVGGRDDLQIEEPKPFQITATEYRVALNALRREFPDWDTAGPRVAAYAKREGGYTQQQLDTLYDPAIARMLYNAWDASGRP